MIDPTLAFVAGLVPTLASVAVALRQTRAVRKLETQKADLQADLHERNARMDRQLNAEELLTRYREPLAAAAFDLQSRCYNILAKEFFEKFCATHQRFADAKMTTLFRFAQYFGWTEILRREVQYLSFPKEQDTKDVAELQKQIADRIASSAGDDEWLMIWVDEQRAIGERMIVEDQGKVRCMGYAAFCDRYDDCFEQLFKRVLDDVASPSSAPRYRGVQHLLCELVAVLEPEGVRFPESERGKA